MTSLFAFPGGVGNAARRHFRSLRRPHPRTHDGLSPAGSVMGARVREDGARRPRVARPSRSPPSRCSRARGVQHDGQVRGGAGVPESPPRYIKLVASPRSSPSTTRTTPRRSATSCASRRAGPCPGPSASSSRRSSRPSERRDDSRRNAFAAKRNGGGCGERRSGIRRARRRVARETRGDARRDARERHRTNRSRRLWAAAPCRHTRCVCATRPRTAARTKPYAPNALPRSTGRPRDRSQGSKIATLDRRSRSRFKGVIRFARAFPRLTVRPALPLRQARSS